MILKAKEENNDLKILLNDKNTIFIDKRKLLLKNLNEFDYNNYLTPDGYIKTNCTLIICPNQLCDQWVEEYYLKFNKNHRILMIVTYDQYKNISLADILFSDIIIISYNFLSNVKYINENRKNTKFVIDNFKINDEIKSNEELLNSKLFNSFHLFKWNRIILDEAHEIENNVKFQFINNYLKCKLKSDFKWNITGTPFPNKLKSFLHLMSYNTDYINDESIDYIMHDSCEHVKKGLDSDIISKCSFLFKRNTKDSIKEHVNNILNEHVKLLTFKSHERSIYDSYLNGYKSKYSDFLLKLCCHPDLDSQTKEVIKNCKTFDEIHKCMLDFNKSLLSKEKTIINMLENELEKSETELETRRELLTSHGIEIEYDERAQNIKNKIQNIKTKLTIANKKHDNISRTFNYLSQSIESLNTDSEISCPICMDVIEKDKKCITQCGHKFCYDCINQLYEKNGNRSGYLKCPSCNTINTFKDLYLLKEDDNKNFDTLNLDEIIQNVKSTKIGNIIYFLKTTLEKNDKVILFSQWDELLHKVGSILEKHNIKLVYCDGTVYNKKRAISSFIKNKDVNIILLSSRNAASGINLTVANKIILLEPIYGSKEYRKDIESQAIGRADRIGQKRPIDIYRFIIKDTIEQDIYNNIVEDGNIKLLKAT